MQKTIFGRRSMRLETPEETKDLAIKLYRKGKNTIPEIANLCGVHTATLAQIYRKCFADGTLQPRRPDFALKHRTPNGQGKDRSPSGIGQGGRSKEHKKFTEEQEHQIAVEYYEQGLSFSQIKQKWGIFPVQMQRIRKQYQPIYGMKTKHTPKYLQKEQKGE